MINEVVYIIVGCSKDLGHLSGKIRVLLESDKLFNYIPKQKTDRIYPKR